MATASDGSVSFDETDRRRDEMHSTIDAWLDDLVDEVDAAQTSERSSVPERIAAQTAS